MYFLFRICLNRVSFVLICLISLDLNQIFITSIYFFCKLALQWLSSTPTHKVNTVEKI